MTAKAALVKHLLSGKVINIKTCFNLIGLTNAPREISRMIEQPFGVIVDRETKSGKSRYGQSVNWIDYRLINTETNSEGIKKMTEYLLKHDETISKTSFKTDNERRQINKKEKKEDTTQQYQYLFS